MNKCVIIAPLYNGEEADWLRPEEGDLVICADGGYDAAKRFGILPDLVIGDFDSMPEDHLAGFSGSIIRLPVHKDDTDMVVCLNEGRRRGYREFRIAGALGGRFDHSLSNVQCLYDCSLRGEEAWLCDARNRVRVLAPGSYRFPETKDFTHLSLLAMTPEVSGIMLKGTVWPLDHASLSARYPLGCSNAVVPGETPVLSFSTGALIVVLSHGG